MMYHCVISIFLTSDDRLPFRFFVLTYRLRPVSLGRKRVTVNHQNVVERTFFILAVHDFLTSSEKFYFQHFLTSPLSTDKMSQRQSRRPSNLRVIPETPPGSPPESSEESRPQSPTVDLCSCDEDEVEFTEETKNIAVINGRCTNPCALFAATPPCPLCYREDSAEEYECDICNQNTICSSYIGSVCENVHTDFRICFMCIIQCINNYQTGEFDENFPRKIHGPCPICKGFFKKEVLLHLRTCFENHSSMGVVLVRQSTVSSEFIHTFFT